MDKTERFSEGGVSVTRCEGVVDNLTHKPTKPKMGNKDVEREVHRVYFKRPMGATESIEIGPEVTDDVLLAILDDRQLAIVDGRRQEDAEPDQLEDEDEEGDGGGEEG